MSYKYRELHSKTMGYCIFTRIAARFPTEESREMFKEWIRESQNDADTRWPILESCKWNTFDADLEVMSRKFPTLIFLVPYTGDNQEIVYYVVNNGNITNSNDINIGHLTDEQKVVMQGEGYYNQQVGTPHDLALQRAIQKFGYEDVSKMFPSANTSDNSSSSKESGDG
jgi:hypothetical protein